MLHIIYRSYGGENKKGRPNYYSKYLALASVIRAYEALSPSQAELVFLNDGPIPSDRLQLMAQSGEIVAESRMGLRGSMRAALNLPLLRRWADQDLVWLAEDDYFYKPDSFAGLIAAGESIPTADYFALYAQIGDRQPNGDRVVESLVPSSWRGSDPIDVLGQPWRKALSTTSTFGARVRPLLDDRAMMQAAMHSGGAWDHTTCLIYQGHRPYSWPALLEPFRRTRGVRAFVRNTGALLLRAGLNAYPILRTAYGIKERLLVSADPALITHLESAYLASGFDWNAFSYDMQAWVTQRKKMLSPSIISSDP